MSFMFTQALAFNQPIGSWTVASVSDMSSMFYTASAFNQPIGGWNVGSVRNMQRMFANAPRFDQPIGTWNTGSVSDMNSMFKNAEAFNQTIGSWTVSGVRDMQSIFEGALAFNQPIGGWNVSSVTNMVAAFRAARAFDQPIGSWDVSSVTNMAFMFVGAAAFGANISCWCVTKISSLPIDFASSSMLNSSLPVWGTCPVRPAFPPVASCGTPPPGAYNISCINGQLQYNLDTDIFLGGNSTNSTTLPPNVQVQLVGNGTVINIKLTAQIALKPGSTSEVTSGLIIVSDCLNIESGQLTIELDNVSLLFPPNGGSGMKTIELMRLLKPECFVDGLNSTVIIVTGLSQDCRKVTATKQRGEVSPGVQSLVVVFTVNTDGCQAPGEPLGPSLPLVAGLVSAAVVVIIAAAVTVALIRKSKERRKQRDSAGKKFEPID
jgi:hypothetical protein